MHRDLSYAVPVGRRHLLDRHLPDDRPGPFPLVIIQLGSAYRRDDTKSGGLRTEAPTELPAGAPTGLGGSVSAARLASRWGPHGYAIAGLNVRSKRTRPDV